MALTTVFNAVVINDNVQVLSFCRNFNGEFVPDNAQPVSLCLTEPAHFRYRSSQHAGIDQGTLTSSSLKGRNDGFDFFMEFT